jgi:D-sedoheptulose 7-phosphate isomerase
LGNGGSNAVASHISQDYVKFHGKRSMVFSDPSMLTCYINDFGMENAYVKFLEAYATQDTLIILISSGGESKNILNCIEWCEKTHKKYGILTGFDSKNSARRLSKNSLWDYHIDSKDYGIVECVHQIFLHGVV